MSYNKIFCFLIIHLVSRTCVESESISEKKCREYAKAVYQPEESPAISFGREKEELVPICGVESGTPLIVGGNEVMEMEFPHMAILGWVIDDRMKWNCGGSLISEWFILTAAHCTIIHGVGPPVKIKLGMHDKWETGTGIQKRDIEQIFLHPEYKPPIKYNDIALVKMNTSATLTKYVRPACLPVFHHNFTWGTLIGYGKTDYYAPTSDVMLKVSLDIFPNSVCSGLYNSTADMLVFDKGITDNIICAGTMKGGKDACSGDSGGPLQRLLDEPFCMYTILGVTSAGKLCGSPNMPGLYTKVTSYMPWIESIVWT